MVNLSNPRYNNGFLDVTPKAQQQKIGILNFMKIKIFCASKDTIKKVNTQRIREKFAHPISDKGLIHK